MKTSQEYIEILREHLPELQARFGIHPNIRPFFRQQIEKDGIDILTAA